MKFVLRQILWALQLLNDRAWTKDWLQIGMKIYVPDRTFQMKPHSQSWFTPECAASNPPFQNSIAFKTERGRVLANQSYKNRTLEHGSPPFSLRIQETANYVFQFQWDERTKSYPVLTFPTPVNLITFQSQCLTIFPWTFYHFVFVCLTCFCHSSSIGAVFTHLLTSTSVEFLTNKPKLYIQGVSDFPVDFYFVSI